MPWYDFSVWGMVTPHFSYLDQTLTADSLSGLSCVSVRSLYNECSLPPLAPLYLIKIHIEMYSALSESTLYFKSTF